MGKKHYKRSLSTTDETEARLKLAEIEKTFWENPHRKAELESFRSKPIERGGGDKKREFWRKNFEINDSKTNRIFNSYTDIQTFLKEEENIEVSENYLREMTNGRKRSSKRTKTNSLRVKLEGRFQVVKSPR